MSGFDEGLSREAKEWFGFLLIILSLAVTGRSCFVADQEEQTKRCIEAIKAGNTEVAKGVCTP